MKKTENLIKNFKEKIKSDEELRQELFRKYTEEGFKIFNIGVDFEKLFLTSDKT